MRPRSTLRRALSVLAACLAAALVVTTVTASGDERDRPDERDAARKLAAAVSVEDAVAHLAAFDRFAATNGGTRVFGSLGHRESADYVADLLVTAGYEVSRQVFTYPFGETLAQRLTRLGPGGGDVPTIVMTYSPSSPSGGVTAPLAAVPPDKDTGCSDSDFAGRDYRGAIVLLPADHGCRFFEKSANAAKAGAVAVLVASDDSDQPNRPLKGTLGGPDATPVPTAGISYADGERLAKASGPLRLRLDAQTRTEERQTSNVIAEIGGGDGDTVMLGAHLDSVVAGPGINDNGSGSAALLEVAEELAKAPPRRPVRFAWWTAEEFGLIGSRHYVDQLTKADRNEIAAYLNFDMIASPNGTLGIYDGDGSLTSHKAAPKGSAELERMFERYFDSVGLSHEETDLDDRSDHGPFAGVGIPVGGLFTGAEGTKSDDQQRRYGGKAGLALDPCYHQACDALGNIDRRLFEQNLRAIAYAVATLSRSHPAG